MIEPAELDVIIRCHHRRQPALDRQYTLELSYRQPSSDASVNPLREGVTIQFDHERLNKLALDLDGYGRALFRQLLPEASPAALAFAKARSASQSNGIPLRLRLAIARDASELHALRWETLCDPADGALLSMGEQAYFSRFLESGDWRPVKLRPKGELRALVAIANPADLAAYGLASLDVAAGLSHVRQALGDNIPITPLSSDKEANAPRCATLDDIVTLLREGYDILYLVCHGMRDNGNTYLFLEDAQGMVSRVAGSELAARVTELAQCPRLIVLMACESAGDGSYEGLTTLGPLLAEVGVPAVVATQGRLSTQTADQLMRVFFRELQSDGRIDRALAIARGNVRDTPDFWTPVLFMRLKSGRIWREEPEALEETTALAIYRTPDSLGVLPRLFGRDLALAQANSLLDQHGHVLLWGGGGYGKTALARAIVRQRLDEGKGAVVWLEARANSSNALLEELARGLGFTRFQASVADPASFVMLRDALELRGVRLIVIDDLRDPATLAGLRSALADSVQLLVTSRERLALDRIDVGNLPPLDAIAFLVHIAGTQVSPNDAEAGRLCALLGYHPLAIEIAGTRLREDDRSPGWLRQRLAGAPHTVEDHARRGIEPLLADSVSVLDEASRDAFLAFGALAAPGASLAILATYLEHFWEATGKHWDGKSALTVAEDALDTLARRSLARRQNEPNFYTLHDLTFSYARALLSREPRAQGVALVAPVNIYLVEHRHDYDLLTLDLTTIVNAIKQAEGTTLVAMSSTVALGGYPLPEPPSYLDVRGHTPSLLEQLDRGIAEARKAGEELHLTLYYLLCKRGNAFYDRADLVGNLAMYREALALAPTENRRAKTLAGLGSVYAELGNDAEAERCLDEARELASDDDDALAFVLEMQCFSAGQRGDHRSARRYALDGIVVSSRLNDPNRLGFALLNLGSAELKLGHAQRADEIHLQALANSASNLFLRADVFHALAEDAKELGNDQLARQYALDALALCREVGDVEHEMRVISFVREAGFGDLWQYSDNTPGGML